MSLCSSVKAAIMLLVFLVVHATSKSLCSTKRRRNSQLLSLTTGVETPWSRLDASRSSRHRRQLFEISPRQSRDRSTRQFKLRICIDEQIGTEVYIVYVASQQQERVRAWGYRYSFFKRIRARIVLVERRFSVRTCRARAGPSCVEPAGRPLCRISYA